MKPTPGDDRPPAPWGSFPLAELTILAGIVALVVGLFGGGATAIGIGVALACLGRAGGLVREHLAGYRSHTTLLAGFVFVRSSPCSSTPPVRSSPSRSPSAPSPSSLAFLGLRRVFQRASGGLSFKVGRSGRL